MQDAQKGMLITKIRFYKYLPFVITRADIADNQGFAQIGSVETSSVLRFVRIITSFSLELIMSDVCTDRQTKCFLFHLMNFRLDVCRI